MNIRYRVALTQFERNELGALLSGGEHPSRKLKRAQILLAADAGISDANIAMNVGVGESTVYRTKRRFVEGNLERALSEDVRPGAERKLTGKEEAEGGAGARPFDGFKGTPQAKEWLPVPIAAQNALPRVDRFMKERIVRNAVMHCGKPQSAPRGRGNARSGA
jgi:hypothetical protein